MMNYGLVLLFTVSCLQWIAIESHPNGSPVCDATADELRKMSEPDGDPSSNAFSIDVQQKPDGQKDYEIRLIGDDYRGFLLYVEGDDGNRVGEWKSAKYLKAVSNKECNDGSTITQVNKNPKTKDTVFTWTPPEDL
ncbi:hypothetical protein BVRB_019630, partial [Beta vulgaris subsp. vulgaris]